MTGHDLFDFYRKTLLLFGMNYAALRTVHAIWCWQTWGTGASKWEAMGRRYLEVQLLRIRVRRFARDLLEIAGLCGVLLVLISQHG